MSKLRAGIAGLDHYHTTGWAASLELFLERLEVVALCDPNPEMGERLAPTYYDPHLPAALPERYRALPFVTSLDELIAGHELDLVLVTLPNAQSPAAVTKLAEAGIHILIDKPGAPDAASARAAFAVARKQGVKVGTGLLRRYGRGWRHAHELIGSGRVGRLLSTEAIFNTSSPFVRNPANHLFSREMQGGGILLWLGIHDIDQLLWLTGERIVEVQAMSGQVNDAGIGVEDAMSISVRYESGAMGTVHCAYVLPRTLSDGYLAVRGSRGSVRVSFDGTVDVIGPGGAADPLLDERLTSTNARVPGYGPYAQAAIVDVLDAIAEDRDPLATGEQLVDALRVIDAAYESASTRRPVAVDWTS